MCACVCVCPNVCLRVCACMHDSEFGCDDVYLPVWAMDLLAAIL